MVGRFFSKWALPAFFYVFFSGCWVTSIKYGVNLGISDIKYRLESRKTKMMNDPVVERVEQIAAELLPDHGLELVEVQFRMEQHGWVLRLFIDTVDPQTSVSLDDCSKVSRELGDILDVEDVIQHAYHLEVSSPGLERKLTKPEHFERFCGRKVKIKLHQPLDEQKTFLGMLRTVQGSSVVMDVEDGSCIEFTFDMISSARLSL